MSLWIRSGCAMYSGENDYGTVLPYGAELGLAGPKV